MKTIFDENDKIIAYPKGTTFSEKEIKSVALNLKSFLIHRDGETLTVFAQTPELAMVCIGLRDSSWEFNDYRFYLEGLATGETTMHEKITTFREIDLTAFKKKANWEGWQTRPDGQPIAKTYK